MNNPICMACGEGLPDIDLALTKPEELPWICTACLVRIHAAWIQERSINQTVSFSGWLKRQDLAQFAHNRKETTHGKL